MVKSFKLSEDAETMSLVVESPARDDIEIKINLSKYDWAQNIKMKCYEKQSVI